jgi:hypothetical protein
MAVAGGRVVGTCLAISEAEGRREQQIPKGNDSKNSNSNYKSKSRSLRDDSQKGKGKGERNGNRTARARQRLYLRDGSKKGNGSRLRQLQSPPHDRRRGSREGTDYFCLRAAVSARML